MAERQLNVGKCGSNRPGDQQDSRPDRVRKAPEYWGQQGQTECEWQKRKCGAGRRQAAAINKIEREQEEHDGEPRI